MKRLKEKSLLLSTGLLKEDIGFSDKQKAANLLNEIYPFFEGHKNMELGVITGLLAGSAHLFQAFHWQTGDKQFYGDHLLYERLYEDTKELVDRVAEKAVGKSRASIVDATAVAKTVLALSEMITVQAKEFEPKDLNAKKAVFLTKIVIHSIEVLFENLKNTNPVSLGVETVVADTVDKFEEFCYLLCRRNVANIETH